MDQKTRKTVIVGLLLFVFLIYTWHRFDSRSSISKDLSVEELVSKAIHMQYRGGSQSELAQVFSPDFIARIDSEPNYFYKKRLFYIIVDKDFMKSFHIINQSKAEVTVRVEDWDGGYFHIMTLTKGPNGKYLISNIEYDI